MYGASAAIKFAVITLGLTLYLFYGSGAAAAPAAVTLWVDPQHGDDGAAGTSPDQPLATVTAAWQRIPAGTALTVPYTIRLAPGDYPEGSFPTYWEERHGTATAPIVVEAAGAPFSAQFGGFVNVYAVEHLTFRNLAFGTNGDVFHCEQCRHLTLQNVRMDGGGGAHETIKINQSQYITITGSDIAGAYENAIDFVAVQYASITDNKIHAAEDWCAYVKGGSAYILVEGNELYDCGTGGFTAGQGTGFEYMTAPWLHYEAYAVRVVNNIIHDTYGAGLGVNGGYNILLAYNTLYRVGARSHLLEFVFGLRTCDGDMSACAARLAAGGWGTTATGAEEPIPNRNIFVFNNLVVNPPGYQSQWQHFAIYGPRTPGASAHIPDPAVTDDNLVIAGNVIWNGPVDHPLGVGGADSGCADANSTCSAAQLEADNTINRILPQFADASSGDWQVTNAQAMPAPAAIPPFGVWDTFVPSVPPGAETNTVLFDFAGHSRSGRDVVGALVAGKTPAPLPPRVYVPFCRAAG